jgi:hypothetical protein
MEKRMGGVFPLENTAFSDWAFLGASVRGNPSGLLGFSMVWIASETTN